MALKLQFKQQDFQTQAVHAVVELFTGQEKSTSTFSVATEELLYPTETIGVGNTLRISPQMIQNNLHSVQTKQHLPHTTIQNDYAFSIEMETGTGKTYVYTKTIYELNRKYGFRKFVVVVPSVAIREGVHKSFQITADHFAVQYDHVPCHVFIYQSAKLSDIRTFATSNCIEVMIINIDAFKKAENIINKPQDRLQGETAMSFLQQTNPIVIIDEPQSVDNTVKAKEAIASLNPLCVLRYSATHREKMNLIYRLTPVDAYQMGLVKQIAVHSNQVETGFNMPYVRLLSVSNDSGFSAKIEIDSKKNSLTVVRKTVTVKQGTDLFLLSGERDLYEGYVVSGIDCTQGSEHIEFANTTQVELGKAIGDVDENLVKRVQIRRTIQTHLDKELRYHDQGIKVLSLFFIDKVEKYRHEDQSMGIYARMFEECYAELIQKPKYDPIRSCFTNDLSKIHDGYFSQDKKGKLKDTRGDTATDESTYNTIMRDKEWLLSFDCPLRFIFSHSALKEGWDNPNVFQVCTLLEQKSTFTCRQKIGRGLRLCVNQEGERIEDKDINVLHVMANESFAEFASTLQQEIESETGIPFGAIQMHMFCGIRYEETVTEEKMVDDQMAHDAIECMVSMGLLTTEGTPTKETMNVLMNDKADLPKPLLPVQESVVHSLVMNIPVVTSDLVGKSYVEEKTIEKVTTNDDAQAIMQHLVSQKYITPSGKQKDTLKNALKTGVVNLPPKYESARANIESIIMNSEPKPIIRDASRDVTVRLNKQRMLSPEFMELWQKLKQRTTYRVAIDTPTLIHNAIRAIDDMPPIPKPQIITQTADLSIQQDGVFSHVSDYRHDVIQNQQMCLPDILTIISDQTLLTPATLHNILVGSKRLADFLVNPEAFLEQVIQIIKDERHRLAIDGISYIKLEGKQYFAQEIFSSEELIANLDRNAIAVTNSIYDYVIYDSTTIERPFAVKLDQDPNVKLFFKIPSRFKIDTPIGTYNPDWAVYFCDGDEEKLYFILETKGSTNFMDLRTREQLKIHCGKKHFEALHNGLDMQVATGWDEVVKKM